MIASLTIAVPSYQRRERLARLLASVAQAVGSSTPCAIDVLVVLDGSTDGSSELIEELAATFPVPLRCHWQPNGGLAAARNAAVARAAGEFVWLLDDDMEVGPEALRCHLDHDRGAARVLMGPAHIATSDPLVLEVMWWYEDRHRRLAEVGRVDDPQDCSFANTSAPTALLRAHPFDESFRGYGIEDYELAVRIHAAGETIAFAAAAGVAHDYRPSRREHLGKLFEEGQNRVRFARLHPDRVEVVFRPWPGRLEKLLRRIARPPLAGALRIAAAAIDRVGTRGPRPMRRRLLVVADKVAVHAGVAAAGGPPALGATSGA